MQTPKEVSDSIRLSHYPLREKDNAIASTQNISGAAAI
jgi:hypothetical protein